MTDIKKKLYIVTLKYNDWRKRLYLEGEDSEYYKNEFEKACIDLNKIGDSSNKYNKFLEKAIRHFEGYGFIRIAK